MRLAGNDRGLMVQNNLNIKTADGTVLCSVTDPLSVKATLQPTVAQTPK